LVTRVVPAAEVQGAAMDFALALARGPLALRYAKHAAVRGLDLPIAEGLRLEADLIARCFASEDGCAGLRSFIDNGPGRAAFSGR
jgi:enoyl-CoA hydratase/carnithine racemase